MSNYTKSTDFASKDNLTSGDPLKIVKGTEIDIEFNNIATAVATKADLASPTFTGTTTIPTASVNSATIASATISSGTITGITDLAVADGGTGASTASGARSNLGLVIGTNVQAWDADLDTWATKTAPSGTVVGTTDTQTLTNKTIQGGAITSGTSVASTSGTSIDFTDIPSWVKRITVMFLSVSTSGTSLPQIQIGSGSVLTSGYASTSVVSYTSSLITTASSGFVVYSNQASASLTGHIILTLISGNTWVASGVIGNPSGTATVSTLSGGVGLSGSLDRVRITTVNGTDTFDAGSINILYEG